MLLDFASHNVRFHIYSWNPDVLALYKELSVNFTDMSDLVRQDSKHAVNRPQDCLRYLNEVPYNQEEAKERR
jgi:hypothetical protein